MKKTLLLIAGGNNQLSIAKEVINQGHKLILVDPNLDCPCSKFAHLQLIHDTRHYLDIFKDIEDQNIKIDGVISDQSDAALKSVSLIAEKFKLPYKNLKVINNTLNKSTQYEILISNGIRVPKTFCCELGQEKDFIEGFDFKNNSLNNFWVLKPADSQGSKGVYIIDSKEELEEKLSKSFKESRKGCVILQEFINGREYSIDALITGGDFYPLVCATKFHYLNNQCIDERNTFINDVEEIVLKNLIETTKSAAKALFFEETLLHAELILSEDSGESYIIEISPRGGGGSISSKIIPYLTGFNANEFIIKTALGELINDLPKKDIIFNQEKFVIMRFLPEFNNKFSDVLISKPKTSELLHLELPETPGKGSIISDSRSRLGYWVIANKNLSELINDENIMLKSLKFLK